MYKNWKYGLRAPIYSEKWRALTWSRIGLKLNLQHLRKTSTGFKMAVLTLKLGIDKIIICAHQKYWILKCKLNFKTHCLDKIFQNCLQISKIKNDETAWKLEQHKLKVLLDAPWKLKIWFAHIYYTKTSIFLYLIKFFLSLKKVDITPIFKKDEQFLKNDYEPVNILPRISKIYERYIYGQMNDFFHPLFSKLQGGFWKVFNMEHCLSVLVEKYCEVLDKWDYAGILLTGLSKVFYCINHELLITNY